MKKNLLLLILFLSQILSLRNTTAQTIPNSGFEYWTFNAGQYMSPDDWETNAADFSITVVQESPGYSGNYALQLNTTGYARSKFPFPQHPANIKAYIKCTISGVDTVNIHISVYSGGNIVDGGDWINSTSIPGWTLITIPVSISFSTVDTLEIIVTGGSETGTSFSIDDFSFDLTNGINDPYQLNNSFDIYTNPSSGIFTIETNNPARAGLLTITNTMGEIISEQRITSPKTEINLSSQARGIYFVKVTTNVGTKTQKIIVQH